MKKGFLKSKIFLLVFTIGFLPEALAQLQCKSAFISLSNLSEKFVPKEIKARLIRNLETSTRDIKTSNLEIIKHILTTYPALKNIRLTKEEAPYLFNKIKKEDRDWCPEGWGLLHLAAYFKNPALLDLLLKVGVNARTKKKTYTESYIKQTKSFEDNALHISIKRNFEEGINIIFKHHPKEKFVRYVRLRRRFDSFVRIQVEPKVEKESKGLRFIDEISKDNQTPWLLALERDIEHKKDSNFTFTHLIGQQRPSLHFLSNRNDRIRHNRNNVYIGHNYFDTKYIPARDSDISIAVADLALKYLVGPEEYINIFKSRVEKGKKPYVPTYYLY